jgi:hypothetical protein
MAEPGPEPVFAVMEDGIITISMWGDETKLRPTMAEKLANDIYDALGIEHVTRAMEIPPDTNAESLPFASQLGQVAYETWVKANGRISQPWESLTNRERTAWYAAADEVVRRGASKQIIDDWFGDKAELEAALKFDDQSLFNDKAINDALSSTISRNDELTNASLILANNVAAVMKLHGFSFDQAMLIVGVAKGDDE